MLQNVNRIAYLLYKCIGFWESAQGAKMEIFISISTLPSHIYSTILSFAKVTCNTHKNKKLLSIPLKLVPSLAKLPLPYFPPSTGRSVSSHPKLVIPFLAPCWAVPLLGAFLTLVRSRPVYGVKVTGVFYDFSIESSCDVFMRICLCFNVLFLRFCRENGGGGGGSGGLIHPLPSTWTVR